MSPRAIVRPMILPDAPKPTRAYHYIPEYQKRQQDFIDVAYSSAVGDVSEPQPGHKRKGHKWNLQVKHNTAGKLAWTAEEDEKLLSLKSSGMRFREIGKQLSRSDKACNKRYQRLMRLGVESVSDFQSASTATE